MRNFRAILGFSGAIVVSCSAFGMPPAALASEGMGIKEAERLCNGERNATPEEVIAGCTRVIQYGGAAFGGVKHAYVNRGYAYRSTGRCEAALEDFDKAISMRANKAHVIRARGSVLLCLKRYPEALAALNSAIEKDPDDAWAYLYRGRVYLAQGDRARAQADFDQAIKLDPDTAPEVAKSLGG